MVTDINQKRQFDDVGRYMGTDPCGTARVREVLAAKGGEVQTVTPSATVLEALKVMALYEIGALVVVSGSLVSGVFSERDYARKIILTGKSSSETTVGEIMSAPATTVTPEYTVAECMATMTERRVRHLPVLDEGRLAGIVSIGDLVKAVISEQGRRIEQFERYIQGAYPR